MTHHLTRRASLLALGAAALAPSIAAAAPASPQDRQAILAMAGDFRVRFDMRETISLLADYTPLEPKLSGGFESVRVIEDRPDFLSLQHLLVVTHDGQTMVIKHWRQDWTYEPRDVLVYAGEDRWRLRDVGRAERAGAWAQTVWQTDDSPRYGGVGRWAHDEGVSRWTSDETARPLPRRDAIRNPPYTRIDGINRHVITPSGWAHEQDNSKLGPREGRDTTFVHEVVLNTYTRESTYDIAAGEAYWAATRDYWAGVRGAWDEAIARGRGVRVEEEAQAGSVTGPRLMGLADEIARGEITTAPALAAARSAIAAATGAA